MIKYISCDLLYDAVARLIDLMELNGKTGSLRSSLIIICND